MLEVSGQPSAVAAGLLALLICHTAPTGAEQNWSTDSPAGRRLQAAVEVINAGDMNAVRTFVSGSFAQRSLDYFGEDDLFDIFYGLFEKYGGLDFYHVRESSPRKEVGVFRCRATGTGFVLGLTVAPEAPHRIRGITLTPLVDADERKPASAPIDEQVVTTLSRIVDRFASRGVFSGIVMIANNGRILFQKACGLANREAGIAITTQTEFNYASLGKMFTAVAVAQLCEAGKLSHEDLIGRYLGPDWIPADIGGKVRIEHLLSHTSGIGGGDFNVAYVEKWVAGGFDELGDHETFTVDANLKFEPGEKYDYSNLGYHLLGAIIEKVSGETYEDYIRSHVFKPAAMTGAELCASDIPLRDLAIGYEMVAEGDTIRFVDNRSRVPNCATPAGLGYATALDFVRFAEAVRQGSVVTPATRDNLLTPKVRLNSPRYGFGFQVALSDGRQWAGHTGGYVGINDSFSMGLLDGYTVVILSNLDILTGTVCTDLEVLIGQMLDP